MAKIYQCAFSGFVYELFEDADGTIRGTKTSMKSGVLCLRKIFPSSSAGQRWLTERKDLDQQFIMAYKQLAEKSTDR